MGNERFSSPRTATFITKTTGSSDLRIQGSISSTQGREAVSLKPPTDICIAFKSFKKSSYIEYYWIAKMYLDLSFYSALSRCFLLTLYAIWHSNQPFKLSKAGIRWWNWGSESLSDFPKLTQLLYGKAESTLWSEGHSCLPLCSMPELRSLRELANLHLVQAMWSKENFMMTSQIHILSW